MLLTRRKGLERSDNDWPPHAYDASHHVIYREGTGTVSNWSNQRSVIIFYSFMIVWCKPIKIIIIWLCSGRDQECIRSSGHHRIFGFLSVADSLIL